MGSRDEAISSILMNAKAYEKVRKSNIKEDDAILSILSQKVSRKTLNQPNSVLMYINFVVDNVVR